MLNKFQYEQFKFSSYTIFCVCKKIFSQKTQNQPANMRLYNNKKKTKKAN